ncbi:MAG: NIPSNAP family protein, partial [Chloroflexi bacterium]|nr:NIPSNAP family protein [Chloroflexota bacterium]
MIYELRIYECFTGKLENLNKRFRNHTLKLFEKHGIKNIGYWVTDVGPSNNTLTYLLAYPSHDARVKSWKDL